MNNLRCGMGGHRFGRGSGTHAIGAAVMLALAQVVVCLFTSSVAVAQPWNDPRFDVDVRFPPPSSSEIIMPAGATHPHDAAWRYTFTSPSASWMTEGFNDAAWSVGSAGFGQYCCYDPLDSQQTLWPTSEIWMRRSFTLSNISEDMVLWGRWDDGIEVYINGVAAYSTPYWTAVFKYAPLSAQAHQALRVGVNLIAVKVTDTGGGRIVDVGLALNPMRNSPSSGYEINPALAVIDQAAAEYFEQNIVPAGAVAVMKGEQIVLNRGYGYMEKTRTTPLPSNAVFRLASLDKTPGSAAARRLIEDGFVDPVTGTTLTLDTPVMPLLVARGLVPLPGHTPDPNINLVTFRHIIEHTSGMTELSWAQDMLNQTGTPLRTYSSWDNVRYIYSKPLAFVPGTGGAYCSSCAMVLRHTVDVLTGGFEEYFEDVVMDGYGTQGMKIVHEPLALREALEPWYETNEMPYERDIYLDHYIALTASAEAYARFCRGYNLGSGHRLINPSTGAWMAVPDNGASWFGGGMAGTRTFAIQRRWDEVTIVVFANCNVDVGALAVTINSIVDTLPPGAWECAAGNSKCPSDLGGDGIVGIMDLLAVIGAWGTCTGACPADTNCDRIVGISELLGVIGAWGACP